MLCYLLRQIYLQSYVKLASTSVKKIQHCHGHLVKNSTKLFQKGTPGTTQLSITVTCMQLALQSQAWSQVSRYFLKVHRKVVGSSYEFFVSALKPRRWNCRDKENKLIPCLLSLFSVLLNCLNFKITVMHRLIKCHNILLSRDRKL